MTEDEKIKYKRSIAKLEELGDFIYSTCAAITCVLIIYFMIAITMFQINNPKANELSLLTHAWAVIAFVRVDEFQ